MINKAASIEERFKNCKEIFKKLLENLSEIINKSSEEMFNS